MPKHALALLGGEDDRPGHLPGRHDPDPLAVVGNVEVAGRVQGHPEGLGKVGLGGRNVVGAGAHTHGEHLVIPDLAPRARVFAGLLERLE